MLKNKRKIISILILVASIFMGIGYASVNSILLNINGNATAKELSGVYITNVSYKNNVGADLNNSKILSAYQTNLTSYNVLSSTNQNSSITYEITIYNSTSDAYRFDQVKYMVGNDTYDNLDISFSIDGIKENDILYGGKTVIINITFFYKDNILSSNHDLKSTLNFNFVDVSIWNLGNVSGTYSLDMDATWVNNYSNLTKDNFFFEPTSIPVESVGKGDMYFEKAYNPSTGIFSFNRTILSDEASPIEVNGVVYAVTRPVKLLTTATGDYTLTIDCSSVPNYMDKEVNDFLIDLTQIYYPSTVYGTMYFSKTYDSKTGILTLKRSSIKGNGLIKWWVNIYYLDE